MLQMAPPPLRPCPCHCSCLYDRASKRAFHAAGSGQVMPRHVVALQPARRCPIAQLTSRLSRSLAGVPLCSMSLKKCGAAAHGPPRWSRSLAGVPMCSISLKNAEDFLSLAHTQGLSQTERLLAVRPPRAHAQFPTSCARRIASASIINFTSEP